MTARRHLAMAAGTSVAVLALTATSGPAAARMAEDRCVQQSGTTSPMSLSAATAAARAGCSLEGRVVTDGRISMVVPPAGTSVTGDGVARSGEPRGLTVTNTGHGIRVRSESSGVGRGVGGGGWYLTRIGPTPTSGTIVVTAPSTTATLVSPRAGSPAACQDRTFHLEHHKWGKGLRYRIALAGMPKRFGKRVVVHQIRAANTNMRTGRNTCGRARLTAPASHYLGRTSARPNIRAKGPTCTKPDGRNVVGFGNLPGGLLGWTCYWWGGNGRMLETDMMIDNGGYLATKLPSPCANTWDFEGTVTHEWGHAYGLAHTGSGHQNLTMQHLLAPCSAYARTLGLGDWLGMNKMYGHRR